MHILNIGLNHNLAPVTLREKVAFSEDQIRASLARLTCGHGNPEDQEMVILSTCNRVELYSTGTTRDTSTIESFLAEIHGLDPAELRPYLFRHIDKDAVNHLFEVACGLDSLVLGEPQILGQVTRALEISRGIGTAKALLTKLFNAAIHTGKRARTETPISQNPTSISSLAAALCEKVVADLPNAKVVILGAGEMAELSIEALRKRGVHQIMVINRSIERAQLLADRWNANANTFENMYTALQAADILISSTGAPHLMIGAEMVNSAMRARQNRPLVLVDIAVPRDIDPEAGLVPNVSLFDIDRLNGKLESSLEKRSMQVPEVKKIISEESIYFMAYFRSLSVQPLIGSMRQQAEDIRANLFEKAMKKCGSVSEKDRQNIEMLTHSIVKQILAEPTRVLKDEANTSSAAKVIEVTRLLFNLPNDERLYEIRDHCELRMIEEEPVGAETGKE